MVCSTNDIGIQMVSLMLRWSFHTDQLNMVWTSWPAEPSSVRFKPRSHFPGSRPRMSHGSAPVHGPGLSPGIYNHTSRDEPRFSHSSLARIFLANPDNSGRPPDESRMTPGLGLIGPDEPQTEPDGARLSPGRPGWALYRHGSARMSYGCRWTSHGLFPGLIRASSLTLPWVIRGSTVAKLGSSVANP